MNKVKVDDIVKTVIGHKNLRGYFRPVTLVKVTGISQRGYDIEDEHGNRITEI